VRALNTLGLPGVQRRLISHQVLAALRRRILQGDVSPGEHLVESEIAAQMGVSRAPVREAIKGLEQEGLVEAIPHRGAVVIGLTRGEIDAIYEVRASVEACAIGEACTTVTEIQLSNLRGLLSGMAQALEDDDPARVAEFDIGFHRAIVEASGYTVLRQTWDTLDGILRVRTMQVLEAPAEASRQLLRDVVRSHDPLLDALVKRDRVLAADAARAHVLEVAKSIHDLG
jgi:DNA-binding GntR family transcriptional regulator